MDKDSRLIFEAYSVQNSVKDSSHKHCPYAARGCKCNGCEVCRANQKEEGAEDMSRSPFHYDPMEGLARAAHQIQDVLKSAADDEASTEHIEKMAEIILGPQSEYASYTEYNRILGGVIELLNHYVVVPMN